MDGDELEKDALIRSSCKNIDELLDKLSPEEKILYKGLIDESKKREEDIKKGGDSLRNSLNELNEFSSKFLKISESFTNKLYGVVQYLNKSNQEILSKVEKIKSSQENLQDEYTIKDYSKQKIIH